MQVNGCSSSLAFTKSNLPKYTSCKRTFVPCAIPWHKGQSKATLFLDRQHTLRDAGGVDFLPLDIEGADKAKQRAPELVLDLHLNPVSPDGVIEVDVNVRLAGKEHGELERDGACKEPLHARFDTKAAFFGDA